MSETTATFTYSRSSRRSGLASRRGSSSRHGPQHVRGHRIALSLDVQVGDLLDHASRRQRRACCSTDEDAADRCVALEPRAKVDGVAENAVNAVASRADDTGQDRARVDAATEPRPLGMVTANRLGDLLQLEPGACGAGGVIRLVARLVEDREDLIADELVHLAAVPLCDHR